MLQLWRESRAFETTTFFLVSFSFHFKHHRQVGASTIQSLCIVWLRDDMRLQAGLSFEATTTTKQRDTKGCFCHSWRSHKIVWVEIKLRKFVVLCLLFFLNDTSFLRNQKSTSHLHPVCFFTHVVLGQPSFVVRHKIWRGGPRLHPGRRAASEGCCTCLSFESFNAGCNVFFFF